MSAAEPVALYGPDGRPTGRSAPRRRVEAERLRHGATYVLVRDSRRSVYVHRRTETKKLYPGAYDFSCGGVLDAGETPDQGGAREAAEELGVTGTPLRYLGRALYDGPADAAGPLDRVVGFLYECTYDGPITWQPEEVAWGTWLTVAKLRDFMATQRFVPDTPALLWDHLAREL